MDFLPQSPIDVSTGSVAWCERGDSNPHGLPRQILSLVRLPIPPLSLSAHYTSAAEILVRAELRTLSQPWPRSQPGIKGNLGRTPPGVDGVKRSACSKAGRTPSAKVKWRAENRPPGQRLSTPLFSAAVVRAVSPARGSSPTGLFARLQSAFVRRQTIDAAAVPR